MHGVHSGSYLEDLCPRLSYYLLSSKSDNTNTNYFNAFNRWKTFINSQGHCALPASSIHFALYLTHLLENGSSQHPVNSAMLLCEVRHTLLASFSIGNGYRFPRIFSRFCIVFYF